MSLPEVILCMRDVDERLRTGYDLDPGTGQLMALVRELERLGSEDLVRIVRLAHDAFMPKTFVILTVGGQRSANAAESAVGAETMAIVDEAAKRARTEVQSAWRIYGRPPS